MSVLGCNDYKRGGKLVVPLENSKGKTFFKQMIEFDWLIHYRCNYKCYYCFFAEHWDYVEKKNIKMHYSKWVEAYKRGKKV